MIKNERMMKEEERGMMNVMGHGLDDYSVVGASTLVVMVK